MRTRGSKRIDHDGKRIKCKKRLIDESHLLELEVLRKLRLMFEDFPKTHNLILLEQAELLAKMSLKVNDNIKSRITYSSTLLKLNSDAMEDFIAQLDKAGLGHNTITDEAIGLIVRSGDGTAACQKPLLIIDA